MPIRLTCACSKSYSVKDELAGKKVRCPQCKAVIAVPAPGSAPTSRPASSASRPAGKSAPASAKLKTAPPQSDPPDDGAYSLADSSPPADPDFDASSESHEHDGPGLDQFQGLKHVAAQIASAAATSAISSKLPGAFRRDVFLLRQKHLSISEKYYIWDERGNVIMFVERPRHFLKQLVALAGVLGFIFVGVIVMFILLNVIIPPRSGLEAPFIAVSVILVIIGGLTVAVLLSPLRHIYFYRDDSKEQKLLEVKQVEKLQLLFANFVVEDPDGKVLAKLQKNYLYNLIRRRWYVLTPDGQTAIARAMEDSMLLSVLRRVLPEIVTIFLRTNFIIVEEPGLKQLGVFNRKFTIQDRYVLDLKDDPANKLDRRVAVALGVLLDTGEKR